MRTLKGVFSHFIARVCNLKQLLLQHNSHVMLNIPHVMLSEPCHLEHGVGASEAKHYGVVSGSQKHALKSKKTNKIVMLNFTKRIGKAEPSLVGLYPKRSVGVQGLIQLTRKRFRTKFGMTEKNHVTLSEPCHYQPSLCHPEFISGSQKFSQEMLKRVQHDKWAKPAFTLSGLLVTVLVSSIILVALAPVISKRVTLAPKKITQTTIKGALFTLNESDLTKCNITTDVDGADENTCSITLPQSVTNINAVLVGFGGNGASAQQNGETIHVIEPFLTSQTKTFSPIMYYNAGDGEKPYYVSNLKIVYMVSGGAGGGAGWGEVGEASEPQSQADCNELAGQSRDISNSQAITKFIPASMNGTDGKNICVTKYNAGDTLGPPIPDTVTRTGTSSSATFCFADSCCWGGETYDTSTNGGTQRTAGTSSSYCSDATTTWDSYSTSYSSCNRTVCTYYAAQEACSAYAPTSETAGKWRLPTYNEVVGWDTIVTNETSSGTPDTAITRYIGDNGIQLCDSHSASYGALRCYYYEGGCLGLSNGYCSPYVVWAASDSSVYFFSLVNGGINGPHSSSGSGLRDAYSARCVLDEISASATAHSGAGGGAGAHLTNQVVHNGILNEEIAISITIGAGGSEGQNGEDTKVEYASTTLITYGAKDDYFGADGTETDFAKASTITKRYTKTNSTQSTYDVMPHEQGADGQSEENVTTSQTATGGQGGSSAYEFYKSGGTGTPTYSGGAQGGNADDPNGKDATTPGAGGGGGTAKLNDDGTIEIGEGGNGADGAVIISYDLIPIPIAGAGGGGAPIAIGTAIPITQNNNEISISFDPDNIDEPKSCQYVPQLNFGTHASGENYIFCGNNSNENTPGTADQDGAIISNSLSQYFEIILGEDGESGGQDLNSINILGGSGGASGANTTFTCGGLNEQDCQKYNLLNTASNADGSDGLFNPTPANIPQGIYGPAGSGGGGGGYDATTSTPTLGQGGKGAQGYVYIWWEE